MSAGEYDAGQRALFQLAAENLAQGLAADRCAVFYLDKGRQLALGGLFGIAKFPMAACPFSVDDIKEAVRGDRNLIYSNVPVEADTRDSSSLKLSGAISLLCVPFYDKAGKPAGALYADTTSKVRAFHRNELLYSRDCARWLGTRLTGRDDVQMPKLPAAKAPSSPKIFGQLAANPKERPEAAAKTSPRAVDRGHLMVFFRSLATLTGAGVPIDSGLRLLGNSAEDKALGEVALGLADAVCRGETISAAMERYPKAFAPQLCAVVRVGERTGQLVKVLEVLATDLEKSHRLAHRMRSALAYPAFLSIACALMMILGPPYVLQGHLRVLAESRIPLPLLTQALIFISNALRNWLFLASLTAGTVGLVLYLRSESGKTNVASLARKTPVIGPIMKQLSLTEFARSLALQTKAGVTAMAAMANVGQGCPDPLLKDAVRQAEAGLRNGDSLTESLATTKYFSTSFLSFVEAGEQTGTLVRLTEWLADFYEQELESSLTGLVALAEPAIMGVMGMVTALLVVATVKPTILILQAL